MKSHILSPNLEQAQQFLKSLNPAPNAKFTFQTFDDNQTDGHVKRKELTKILIGSFDEKKEELARLNQLGAGIFVTINETNGHGRKASDVIGVRALFADLDKGVLPNFLIEPSVLVQTKRGYQAYWLMHSGQPLESFGIAQRALAHHLDGDGTVIDLPRVLRLAGFSHQKDPNEPFLIQILNENRQRFHMSEVMAAYPPPNEFLDDEKEEKNSDWLKRYTGDLRTLDVVSLLKEAKIYCTPIGKPEDRKHSILCPNRAEHSKNDDGTRSTVVIAAEGKLPILNCFHGHCIKKVKIRSLLEGLGSDLVDRHCHQKFRAEARLFKRSWPSPLPEAALYGLAGDIVRAIEPHTEADSAAILLQFLVAFGNVIGRNAYYQVEATRHHMNLFALVVGDTSKARKGTSWGHILRLFESVDSDWQQKCILGGLSSGEGLIWAVRDPVYKQVSKKDKDTGERSTEEVMVDKGVVDKRLLLVESEFSSVLKQFERDGNTLSSLLRNCWDAGNLKSLVKNSNTQATNSYISMIGHITTMELRRLLTETDSANGFGNRLLWACARRSKFLPEGGEIEKVNFGPLLKTLTERIANGKAANRITKNAEATEIWAKEYRRISDAKPGMIGAITSRAEAQVLRLSCVYALLDGSFVITAPHLNAALALWEYLDQSCEVIFEDAIGDPVADEILRALRNNLEGLTRTQIRDLFNRNVKAGKVQPALDLLHKSGLARVAIDGTESGGGRPTERWFAIPAAAAEEAA